MPQTDRPSLDELENPQEFIARHLGPSADDERHMLAVLAPQRAGFTRQALIEAIVPPSIRRTAPMALPAAVGEVAGNATRQVPAWVAWPAKQRSPSD